MISDRAITLMEQTAESVGFGPRPDYPYLGASPLSVGDMAGSSISACVFAHPAHAEEYLDKCLRGLDAHGGPVRGYIHRVLLEHGDEMYIAVLTALDLVAASEVSDDNGDPIGTYDYGLQVHPTAADILEQNSRDPHSPTYKQVRAFRRLCTKKGITESHLIAMGVKEKRLSPIHAENGGTAELTSLTRREIGALFAFVEWLKQ